MERSRSNSPAKAGERPSVKARRSRSLDRETKTDEVGATHNPISTMESLGKRPLLYLTWPAPNPSCGIYMQEAHASQRHRVKNLHPGPLGRNYHPPQVVAGCGGAMGQHVSQMHCVPSLHPGPLGWISHPPQEVAGCDGAMGPRRPQKQLQSPAPPQTCNLTGVGCNCTSPIRAGMDPPQMRSCAHKNMARVYRRTNHEGPDDSITNGRDDTLPRTGPGKPGRTFLYGQDGYRKRYEDPPTDAQHTVHRARSAPSQLPRIIIQCKGHLTHLGPPQASPIRQFLDRIVSMAIKRKYPSDAPDEETNEAESNSISQEAGNVEGTHCPSNEIPLEEAEQAETVANIAAIEALKELERTKSARQATQEDPHEACAKDKAETAANAVTIATLERLEQAKLSSQATLVCVNRIEAEMADKISRIEAEAADRVEAIVGLTTHEPSDADQTRPPNEQIPHTTIHPILCLQKRRHLTRDLMVRQRIAWEPIPTPEHLQARIRAHTASEMPTTGPPPMSQRPGYREGRDRSLSQFPRAGTPSPETQSDLSPQREGWVPCKQYLDQHHTCGRHTGGRPNPPPPPDRRRRLPRRDKPCRTYGIKHASAQTNRAQAKSKKRIERLDLAQRSGVQRWEPSHHSRYSTWMCVRNLEYAPYEGPMARANLIYPWRRWLTEHQGHVCNLKTETKFGAPIGHKEKHNSSSLTGTAPEAKEPRKQPNSRPKAAPPQGSNRPVSSMPSDNVEIEGTPTNATQPNDPSLQRQTYPIGHTPTHMCMHHRHPKGSHEGLTLTLLHIRSREMDLQSGSPPKPQDTRLKQSKGKSETPSPIHIHMPMRGSSGIQLGPQTSQKLITKELPPQGWMYGENLLWPSRQILAGEVLAAPTKVETTHPTGRQRPHQTTETGLNWNLHSSQTLAPVDGTKGMAGDIYHRPYTEPPATHSHENTYVVHTYNTNAPCLTALTAPRVGNRKQRLETTEQPSHGQGEGPGLEDAVEKECRRWASRTSELFSNLSGDVLHDAVSDMIDEAINDVKCPSRKGSPEDPLGPRDITVAQQPEPSHRGGISRTPEPVMVEASPVSTNDKEKIRKRCRKAASEPISFSQFPADTEVQSPQKPAALTGPEPLQISITQADIARHHCPPSFTTEVHSAMEELRTRRMYLPAEERAALLGYERARKQAWAAALKVALDELNKHVAAEKQAWVAAKIAEITDIAKDAVAARRRTSGTSTENRQLELGDAKALPLGKEGPSSTLTEQNATRPEGQLVDCRGSIETLPEGVPHPKPLPTPQPTKVKDDWGQYLGEGKAGDAFRKVERQRRAKGLRNQDTCNEPPVKGYGKLLQDDGLTNIEVEGIGNCSILAPIAGREEKSLTAIAHPTTATRKLVQRLRARSVDLITSDGAIGHTPAEAFRTSEGLNRYASAAAREMAPWREARYYRDDVPHRAATFIFGLARAINRPIVTIQANKNGHLLNPGRIYGASDKDGNPLLVAGTSISPPITPAYTNIYFDEIRTLIQQEKDAWIRLKEDPKLFSLIQFHPTAKHWTAWVRKTPPLDTPAPGSAEKAVAARLIAAPAAAPFRIAKVKPPPEREATGMEKPPQTRVVPLSCLSEILYLYCRIRLRRLGGCARLEDQSQRLQL